MGAIFLPALRGIIGDWVYYSCLFPMGLLAERVSFANDLHQNEQLSDMIQRELSEGRSKEIAEYLNVTKERFFSSLVVAVHEGDPQWFEVGSIKPPKKAAFLEGDIPDNVRHSIGLLRLSGEERLFAIDGQHRLAGIKKALQTSSKIRDEEVSVLLVGHKTTKAGMQRTRRLFTTLNKTAVEVSKGEIIALDEDDTMAICVRRLLESSELFRGGRLSTTATSNLPAGDTKSLTTIGNLYDVLSVLFEKCKGELSYEDLRFIRPDDKVLDSYFMYSQSFFENLKLRFPVMKEYFESSDPRKVIIDNRGEFGGNVLLRPVGLLLFTEVIAVLCAYYSIEESIKFVSELPQQIQDPPYADIIWDTRRHKIINSGRAFARKVLLYLLGDERTSQKIFDQYSKRLGDETTDITRLESLRVYKLPLSLASLRAEK